MKTIAPKAPTLIFEELETRLLFSADGAEALAADAAVEQDVEEELVISSDEEAESQQEQTAAEDVAESDEQISEETVTDGQSAAPTEEQAATNDDEESADTTESVVIENEEEETETEGAAEERVTELVFISSGITDSDELIEGILGEENDANIVLIILDANEDGISQISDVLDDYQDLQTIHFLTHGYEGQINLGDTILTNDTLDEYGTSLEQWGESLSETGDILFYGCDIGAGEDGTDLLTSIAELTGADVAASDDRTGHESLGGDWDLESSVGLIESEIVVSETVQQSWVGTLAVSTFEQGVAGYTGSQDTYVDNNSSWFSGYDSHEGESTVVVDYDSGLFSSDRYEGLIRFDDIFARDGGLIPEGVTITSAELLITVYSTGASDEQDIRMYEVTRSWVDTDDWGDLGDGIYDDLGRELGNNLEDLGTGQISLDVTASIQDWLDGVSTNNGWGFRDLDSSGGTFWEFYSSESSYAPQLVVSYNYAPVITSSATVSVAENTTAVQQVTYTDVDVPADTMTFNVSGGVDSALFSIDSAGNLSFVAAPDYEAPGDSGLDNIYNVQVSIYDGYNITTQDIEVTVTAVNDNTPVFTSSSNLVVGENFTGSYQLTASDADLPSQTLSYSITGTGTDDARFTITADGNASFLVSPDYENPTDSDGDNVYTFDVQVTDGLNSTVQTITITVTDVNESPVSAVSDSDGAANSVVENSAGGTAVGITAFANDSDGTDTVTYGFDVGGNPNSLFAIDSSTGVITVAGGALLDRETAASHDITVLATSTDGSTRSQSFTIDITDVDEFDVGAVTDSDITVNSVSEGVATGTAVGITALAADGDATDSVSYSLSSNPGNLFAIDAVTGVVTVNSATLDYENAVSHDITVLATSTDGSSSSLLFTIAVTDVNEFSVGAVSDSDGLANSVSEGATAGTTVGLTGFAVDADGTAIVTYSLSDDAGGLFTIDAGTGVVTVNSATLDYETAISHSVTVLATSDDGSSRSQSFVIDVVDVDEFDVGLVSDTDTAANQVSEDAAIGTEVGVTALAVDADGTDSITYSLSDDAGGLFAIDTVTGVISVNSTGLNYETAVSHNVTVVATSSDLSTSQASFTINVGDVNEFAVGAVSDSDAAVNTVSEDAIGGTVVGITAVATDADGSDTVSYSLSDNAGGLFAIDGNTGVVTVLAPSLDYETATSHTVTVLATSSDTSTRSQTFTISVTDVDEFAVGAVSDADVTVNNVDEDATVGTTVGITALATDGDGTDVVTYSLSSNPGNLFAIDTVTGVISVNIAGLDYETQTSHDVTVLATSSDLTTSTQVFTINVNDINEAGVGVISDSNPAANTVYENAIAGTSVWLTAFATDADLSDTVSYSFAIGGNPGSLFAINSVSGIVTVASGAVLDRETAASHDITVLATSTDSSFRTQTFTINVLDVNEYNVGAVTDSDGTTDSISEDAAVGTVVGVTATATDLDATAVVTYSLSANPSGLFAIDANSGVITVNTSSFDYETAVSHTITVRADSDDGSFSTQDFTIAVTDVNEFSVGPVTDSNLAANTVNENAVAGTQVGITALATDADGTAVVTYSLTDSAGGLFTIDGNSGVVSVAAGASLDREVAASHAITVLATSNDNSTRSQTFVIDVLDVDEYDVGAVTDSDGTTDSISEDAAVGTVVGVTATATDLDATAAVTYSLSANPSGLFAIDANSGVITVNSSSFDYETAVSHTVTVRADSDDGSFSTQDFTIAVTDVNEFSVGAVSDTDTAVDTVSEGSSIGTNVGITALANDADGTDSVSYSLSDDAGGLFSIDAVTGVVQVAASGLDYETATSHDITVRALSTDGSTSTRTFTIAVTDVNESAISSVTDSDAATNEVLENATVGAEVGVIALASDADGTDSVSYSLSDDAGGLFSIDAVTGMIRVASASLDYETSTSHSVTVQALSTDGTSSSQGFTINVLDVNEFAVGPVTDSDSSVNTVSESAGIGTTVGVTALATDADGTAGVSYSLTDNPGGLFSIDGSTGVLSVAAGLDYETATTHSVTVRALSTDGSTSDRIFTIAVTDVNEFGIGPVTDSDTALNTVSEDAGVGTAVGVTASATDGDGSDIVSYSLTDDAGGLFSIDGSTGAISVAAGLDYETAITHNVTVQALSTDGSTNSNTFSIAVTDVNEFGIGSVTDSDTALNTVGEDAGVGTVVGVTASAIDGDGSDIVSYSLTDDAGGLFSIDGSTGVISVAAGLDYETATSHNVTVQALSTDGTTDSTTFTIAVTDVNEFAIGTVTDSDGTGDTVDENSAVGTTVGVTAVAVDGDGSDTVSYSLTDDAGGLFGIDSTTGVITVAAAGLDYETAVSHSVTVQALSDDGSTSNRTFTINVVDVNEFAVGAVSDIDAVGDVVNEDASAGAAVGITVQAVDGDSGDTVGYSLTNDAGGLFSIDATSGVISLVSGTLDYESSRSYGVTVLATSTDGSSSSRDFTIHVGDVNEFGIGSTTDSDSSENSVEENVPVGTVVGVTGAASDGDGSDSVNYALTDDAGGLFVIDPVTGVITVASAELDFENISSYTVTVLSTSSDGTSSSQNFTISIIDMDEPLPPVDEEPVEEPVDEEDLTDDELLPEDDTGTDEDADQTDDDENPDEVVLAEAAPEEPMADDNLIRSGGSSNETGEMIADAGSSTTFRAVQQEDYLVDTPKNIKAVPAIDNLAVIMLQDLDDPLINTMELSPAQDLDFRDSYIVNSNMDLQVEVEALLQDFDSAYDDAELHDVYTARLITGSTVSLSVGVVSYLLRGGALMSSLLSSMPLWKGFDPVGILLLPKKKRKEKKAKIASTKPSQDATEHLFDKQDNE